MVARLTKVLCVRLYDQSINNGPTGLLQPLQANDLQLMG
jgi:hypothetical protein